MVTFNTLMFSTLHGNGSVENIDEDFAEHPVDLNQQVGVSSFQVADDLPEDNDSEEQVQVPSVGDLSGQVQEEGPPEEVLMEEEVTGSQLHDDQPGDDDNLGLSGNLDSVNIMLENADDSEGQRVEKDVATAKKGNEKKKKESSYSTLNRRVNNALKATKAKVETFQAKYGGEPDYILIIRDNMTETNESGRSSRTNRKVVVTGEGSLCEEFLYKGLKFNPKSMNFVRKGKTLEKDFDKLEEWLEKRVELTSPNNPGHLLNQPQISSHPFGSPQISSIVVQPFGMFTPSYTTPVVMNNTTPVVMINTTPEDMNNSTPVITTNTRPVASTSSAPLNISSTTPVRMSSTPLSVSRVELSKNRKKPRRLIDSESSSDESDHGVQVKKKKVPILPAARRKSNNKDLLQRQEITKVVKVVKASQKKKQTGQAPATKKPAKVSKPTAARKVTGANNNGGKVADEKENREPNVECIAPTVEPSVEQSCSEVDSSMLTQPGKEKITNWLNTLPDNLSVPTSVVFTPSQVVSRPLKRKPVVTNLLVNPTEPVKPAVSKTLGLAKPAAPPVKPVGITARTKALIEKALEKTKPKVVKDVMTDEEIASILNEKDVFSTPSRKFKMKRL